MSSVSPKLEALQSQLSQIDPNNAIIGKRGGTRFQAGSEILKFKDLVQNTEDVVTEIKSSSTLSSQDEKNLRLIHNKLVLMSHQKGNYRNTSGIHKLVLKVLTCIRRVLGRIEIGSLGYSKAHALKTLKELDKIAGSTESQLNETQSRKFAEEISFAQRNAHIQKLKNLAAELEKKSQNNDSTAQYSLSLMYEYGAGVELNRSKAFSYMNQALGSENDETCSLGRASMQANKIEEMASHGNEEAGVILAAQKNVDDPVVKHANEQFLLKKADHPDAWLARLFLGLHYANEGKAQEAINWLTEAANLGITKAVAELISIYQGHYRSIPANEHQASALIKELAKNEETEVFYAAIHNSEFLENPEAIAWVKQVINKDNYTWMIHMIRSYTPKREHLDELNDLSKHLMALSFIDETTKRKIAKNILRYLEIYLSDLCYENCQNPQIAQEIIQWRQGIPKKTVQFSL